MQLSVASWFFGHVCSPYLMFYLSLKADERMSVTNVLYEPTASRRLKELAGKPWETQSEEIIPGQEYLFH